MLSLVKNRPFTTCNCTVNPLSVANNMCHGKGLWPMGNDVGEKMTGGRCHNLLAWGSPQ